MDNTGYIIGAQQLPPKIEKNSTQRRSWLIATVIAVTATMCYILGT